MNRRKLLTLLASLPLIGGAAARALAKPERTFPYNVKITEHVGKNISKTTFANAGETVTCENGHPIFDFRVMVCYGEMQNPSVQITNWRQTEPKIGEVIPNCAICGTKFAQGSGHFHFQDGWR